jgi:hypothetical protein
MMQHLKNKVIFLINKSMYNFLSTNNSRRLVQKIVLKTTHFYLNIASFLHQVHRSEITLTCQKKD